MLFVPYTNHRLLAKKLREAELKLNELTGYRMKVVETSGSKLEDLLHRSDPWQGLDCLRHDCLLCKTKVMTGKQDSHDCARRSVVYETWCITCQEKAERQAEEDANGDAKVARENKEKIRRHIYIGKTSRSTFERGWEHLNDMETLSSNFFLKAAHGVCYDSGEKRKTLPPQF